MIFDYEDIISFNPAMDSQRQSVLNHLEQTFAFLPEKLCEAATLLDEYEVKKNPHFACFFQLPFPISLNQPVIGLIGKQKGLFGEAHFSNHFLSLCGRNTFRLTHHPVDKSTNSKISQVIMYFPYWGKRHNYYEKYSQCIDENGTKNQIIVPKHLSWWSFPDETHGLARPMRVTDFEYNLAWRVHRECHFAIGRFLVEYSLKIKTELRCPYPLYNFFVMPSPGRVTYANLPRPILSAFLENNQTQNKNEIVATEQIEMALKSAGRETSQFQLQLLSLQKVYKNGEGSLCLIGIISLLEWLLNDRYFPDEKRQKQLTLLLKEKQRLPFLSKHRDILFRAIQLRNESVHGAPPKRDALFVPANKKTNLFMLPGMTHSQSKKFFDDLFKTAMAVFRDCNASGNYDTSM